MNMGRCRDCPVPPEGERFWCQRHGVWKTAHHRELCRTKPSYFAAWERGDGPGQPGWPIRPKWASIGWPELLYAYLRRGDEWIEFRMEFRAGWFSGAVDAAGKRLAVWLSTEEPKLVYAIGAEPTDDPPADAPTILLPLAADGQTWNPEVSSLWPDPPILWARDVGGFGGVIATV